MHSKPRRELRESDIAEPDFRCPIGLPLGKDTPEEIAISIAAEMLQVRGSEKNSLETEMNHRSQRTPRENG